MKAILEWAKQQGRDKDISQELLEAAERRVRSLMLKLKRRYREMEAARRARNFQASDAIRAELTSAGLLVEITKDGVRWRRK